MFSFYLSDCFYNRESPSQHYFSGMISHFEVLTAQTMLGCVYFENINFSRSLRPRKISSKTSSWTLKSTFIYLCSASCTWRVWSLKRTKRNLSVLKVLYLKEKEMQNMRNRWRWQETKERVVEIRVIHLKTDLAADGTCCDNSDQRFIFLFSFPLCSSFTNEKLIFPSHRLRL